MNPGAVAEVFSASVSALQQQVECAGDCSASGDARLAAANTFAELLADLWPTLETQGEHLAELIALIDMAVSGLPEQAENGNAEAAVQVLEVLALLEAYFETPDDAEVVEALLEITSSGAFDPPLSAEAAALWLALQDETEGAPEDLAPIEQEISQSAQPDTTEIQTTQQPELADEAIELLGLLAAAVEEMGEELVKRIDDIAESADGSIRGDAALAIQEILVCLADAAAQVEFLAFSTVCASLGYKIASMPTDTPWSVSHVEILRALPTRLRHYLFDPLAESTRLALVETLCADQWTESLSDEDALALIALLYDEPQRIETETGPRRPLVITADDLSLRLADEVDTAIFASFRREGETLTHQLATVVQQIIAGDAEEDALRQAQRFAHTIKGSANVCGVRAIALLGHYLEDLLEFLTEHDLAPGVALGDTLAAGVDALAIMFDIINGVEPDDPDSLRPIMQAVLDWANRIDCEGVAAIEATPLAPESVATESADTHPAQPAVTLAATQADTQEVYLQVPAKTVEELLRLVGELSMALSQSEQQLGQAQRTLRETAALEQRNLLHIAELETLVDLRGLGTHAGARAASDSAEVFDPIELEQYNEMYIATRRLNEGVSDTRELTQTLDTALRHLGELSQHQIKLNQQLRQLTMGTRLVAVTTVVARLERVVRQTCRSTAKAADLHVHGSEARIDGDLLDRLMPAMMHMIRNAIDHGIESPDEREAAGKPRQGRIEIHVKQLGDQVELMICDDGRGLDLEQIRSKAIDKGLIDASADLTAQELAMLTLRPGFSTRAQVSQVSGRGVGMDVVANTIRALNGVLELDTQPGVGYRFVARMPSSLLAMYCLLVECNAQLLAIPANEVRLAILAQADDIEQTADGWSVRHAEGVCPLIQLDQLMGFAAHAPGQGRQVVLLVETDTGEQAVMVDALLDGRELVVMQLGPLVPQIPGLVSASILGDGRVVPIVELRTLMQVASGADLSSLGVEEMTELTRLPKVLIVDDSLSMRNILSRLVEDGGYQPLSARDGMEAIQILSQNTVDLVLVDMEMPQMNGLELTTHLRTQPDTRDMPIAMITSRSTDKHRREAIRAGVDAYFVKPYRDDAVLDFLQQALEQAS